MSKTHVIDMFQVSRKIEGSSDEMLIKEVDVNRSGSLVVWSTISKNYFDLISNGEGVSEDSVLISGFSISTDATLPLPTHVTGEEFSPEFLRKPRLGLPTANEEPFHGLPIEVEKNAYPNVAVD
ncbi:hypothetical protein Tco_0195536 [Tanacetum coccineum]